MMRKRSVFMASVLCLVLVSGCLLGCSQNTEAPVDQPSRQVQAPFSDQAAQGSKSDVRVWVINAPGENGIPGDESNLVLHPARGHAVLAGFGGEMPQFAVQPPKLASMKGSGKVPVSPVVK